MGWRKKWHQAVTKAIFDGYYSILWGCIKQKSIVQRIKCDYKQGKGYRYFTDNFISEVYYNNISDESKYCYLKTKCLPSQRVSSKPYDVWVIVKKNFKYEVGGAILSAYCTCTAGLLGSFNHVAGLLYRVEAAVLIEVTHPTCTSMLASWNVLWKKKQIIPGRIKDFLFKSESIPRNHWNFFFLIEIHSMQGWTTTTRHGVIGKRSTTRLQHTGNLFRKTLQLKDLC